MKTMLDQVKRQEEYKAVAQQEMVICLVGAGFGALLYLLIWALS